MSRDVPFKPHKICDECGGAGAFDFMGDYYCPECVDRFIKDDEEEQCSHSS